MKREQHDAIRAVCVEKKECSGRTSNGIREITDLSSIASNVSSPPVRRRTSVVNFFPLNASMRDQVEKLEGLLDVCIIQSVVEEGNKRLPYLKMPGKVVCFLVTLKSSWIAAMSG